MYLLDGSVVGGILPYVEYDTVMKHPLWGSNLLFNNEEVVVKGHRDYIRAGAEFLTTNTYQASIEGFQKHLGLNYEQSFQLIKKSVTICRQAIMEESSGRTVRIMGSVGPYGASLCDGSEYNGNYIGKINSKDLYDWHKPRIQALVEADVDVLLFETIPSIEEADILLKILAEYPNQKACLSFSCKDSKHISHGETFASAVEKFWSNDSRKQLIAIGMNCLDPRLITPLLMSVNTENVDFITYPNGGGVWDAVKKSWDTTQMYQFSSDDLNLWSKKGLKLIGGCCNTDVTEISRIRNLIDNLSF